MGYSTSWHAALSTLRTTGQFFDLILVVDDGHLPAHRAVVSCCSPILSRALSVCHHPHPAVVLRGVNMVQMRGLLDFMYTGETRVEKGALETFLKAAEELSVTGLSEAHEMSFEQEDTEINKSDIIDDALDMKTPKKRPKSSSAGASPENKKGRKNGMKPKMTKDKKTKKDSTVKKKRKKKSDIQESLSLASSKSKEDYEATSPLLKKHKLDSQAGDKHENDVIGKPEIDFMKVVTPNKRDTKSDNAIGKSPKIVLDEEGEELTVKITPAKKIVTAEDLTCGVDTNIDRSSPGSVHLPSTPKRRFSPGGGVPPFSSPIKSASPSGRRVLTNLPHDRAKLRDIWDTLVAAEDIEGEVVYSCLHCEKTFRGKSAKSNAWSHVDHNHTPHIEHKCHICDFTSKSNDGISRHISKIHRKDQAKKEEQKIEVEEEEEDMIVLD